MNPKKEWGLVEEAKKDKEKFGPLYEHYYPHIKDFFRYRVNDYEAAEELTSTTFEKALTGLDNFQWQGVPFSAWLYRIARNTLVDHYRKGSKIKDAKASIDYLQELPAKEKGPSEIVESMFSEELIYALLKELPSREQEIIYLKFFDGYQNKVIAKLTNLSETNVGTIIYRTIRKLRKLYQEESEEPDITST